MDTLKVLEEIDDIIIPFIHVNHLILSKINTGKARDKAEVEEFQKIQKAKKRND